MSVSSGGRTITGADTAGIPARTAPTWQKERPSVSLASTTADRATNWGSWAISDAVWTGATQVSAPARVATQLSRSERAKAAARAARISSWASSSY